jgi:hypothetical protein
MRVSADLSALLEVLQDIAGTVERSPAARILVTDLLGDVERLTGVFALNFAPEAGPSDEDGTVFRVIPSDRLRELARAAQHAERHERRLFAAREAETRDAPDSETR